MTLMGRLDGLVVLAILPAIALLFYNGRNERTRRQADAEAHALRYARLISGEIDRPFEGTRALVSAIAEAPVLQGFRDPGRGRYLVRLENADVATTSVSLRA